MAPEQHLGEKLTAAADQYAFCVALWEALCQESPFPAENALAEKQSGPPPWPNAEVAASVASAIRRGLQPRAADRWPSMSSLLDALELPRERRPVAGIALGTTAVFASAAAVWVIRDPNDGCDGAAEHPDRVWNESRQSALRERFDAVGKDYARVTWLKSQQIVDAYVGTWEAAYRDACEATVRNEQSPDLLDRRMACLWEALGHLDASVTALSGDETKVVERAIPVLVGLPDLGHCSDTTALSSEAPLPPQDQREAVAALEDELATGDALLAAGRFSDAVEHHQRIQDAAARIDDRPALLDATLFEARLLQVTGRSEESADRYEDVVREGVPTGRWDAVQEASVRLLYMFGSVLRRPEEGLRYRPLAEGLSLSNPEHLAGFKNNLAVIRKHQGRTQDAVTLYEEALELRTSALGPSHILAGRSRANLAGGLAMQGQFEDAKVQFAHALKILEENLGPSHPGLAKVLINLSSTRRELGQLEDARADLERALSLLVESRGPLDRDLATARYNLGMLLRLRGEPAAAIDELQAAVAAFRAAVDLEDPFVATLRMELGRTFEELQDFASAEREFTGALAIYEAALPAGGLQTTFARLHLAEALAAQCKTAQARVLTNLISAEPPNGELPEEVRTRLSAADLRVNRVCTR